MTKNVVFALSIGAHTFLERVFKFVQELLLDVGPVLLHRTRLLSAIRGATFIFAPILLIARELRRAQALHGSEGA